jgi:hypothetical protein
MVVGTALFCLTRAAFEFPDLGHVCGDAPGVLALTGAVAALGLGDIVIFRQVRLLFSLFSVAELLPEERSRA